MLQVLPAIVMLQAAMKMNPPAVGEIAPMFDLHRIDHSTVRLKSALRNGPVVLVVLRGFPGYQCPFCTKQVGDWITHGDNFAKRNASVIFVYPGPVDGLEGHLKEFVGNKEIPKAFTFTLDPGFGFTNQYHLRWDAPNETSYPSTFVIARDGHIRLAKISHDHDDRASADAVLAALDKLN